MGKLTTVITSFFMNLFFSLIVGVVLNIVSFVQYKASLKRRERKVEDLAINSLYNHTTTMMELNQKRKRVKDTRKIKRNIYVVILLFSVSILSKLAILLSAIWQVKVFDQCLGDLYQNLFFGAVTLNF